MFHYPSLGCSASNQAYELSTRTRSAREDNNKGMILPFQPLTMTFHNVNYFVDMPKVGELDVLAGRKTGQEGTQKGKIKIYVAGVLS